MIWGYAMNYISQQEQLKFLSDLFWMMRGGGDAGKDQEKGDLVAMEAAQSDLNAHWI